MPDSPVLNAGGSEAGGSGLPRWPPASLGGLCPMVSYRTDLAVKVVRGANLEAGASALVAINRLRGAIFAYVTLNM